MIDPTEANNTTCPEHVRVEMMGDALFAAWANGTDGWGPGDTGNSAARDLLRRLDAADPLRALLPEVITMLESAKPPQASTSNHPYSIMGARRWITKKNDLLTRLQALTTEDPTDD